MIRIRRSTVLADIRSPENTVVVQVGRRCSNCPRVGAQDDWPRQPGPLSSPAFATGVTIAIIASAAIATVLIGSAV
jgi:hypothetical protein